MKYLPLVLGIACILGTSYQLYRSARLTLIGERVEGTVIRNQEGTGKSHAYYPIVAFRTVDGARFEVRGQSGSYPAEYEVNETVTVHYEPANPENAFIGSFFAQITNAFMTVALGGVFVWFGLKILMWDRKKKQGAAVAL